MMESHELISHGDGLGVYRCSKSDDTYDIDSCHAPSECPGCGALLDLKYDVRLVVVDPMLRARAAKP